MSEATPEVQAEAAKIGWKPLDQFRGAPEAWVDADEFLRRGEEFLPIVKAHNRKLETKVDQLMAENQRLTAAVSEQRKSMDDLIEYSQAELKARLENQRRQLKSELRTATREDDDTLVEQLEERLDETQEALDNIGTKGLKKVDQPNTPPRGPAPEFLEWKASNEWYQGSSRADVAKTAAADRFAAEVSAEGLRGKAFFDAVDARLAEAFPSPKRRDPTEDGRPSGGGGSSYSPSNGFNALPADAKAQAKSQVSKFVGPNKIFKTEKAWFDHYAKQYNAISEA